MVSVCVLSAAWRRFQVTRLVLAQRERLVVELAARGVDAVNLIVADDENLDIARSYGCVTVEAANDRLGAKCNIGLRAAADLADYVCWVGSDDWIHPDVFDILPALDRATRPIVHGRRIQFVDLQHGRMQLIESPSQYGAIPWILDSRLLRTNKPPLQPDLRRGLDGALIRGIRLARIPFRWVLHDPHPFRCVDFKSGENITPYAGPAKNLAAGPEDTNPWDALGDWYPADLVHQAEALSRKGVLMVKLVHPVTGATVSASAAGAILLEARGYKPASLLEARGYKPASAAPAANSPASETSWPGTHKDLDEVAARIGFEWPGPDNGRPRLTVHEKIAALAASGYVPPATGE